MGVGEDHLELVSDSDSLHHVADGGADSAQHGVSLLLLQPHAELEGGGLSLVIGLLANLNGDVFEATGEGAQLALHDYLPCLHVDTDSFGDFEGLLSHDVLHL